MIDSTAFLWSDPVQMRRPPRNCGGPAKWAGAVRTAASGEPFANGGAGAEVWMSGRSGKFIVAICGVCAQRVNRWRGQLKNLDVFLLVELRLFFNNALDRLFWLEIGGNRRGEFAWTFRRDGGDIHRARVASVRDAKAFAGASFAGTGGAETSAPETGGPWDAFTWRTGLMK